MVGLANIMEDMLQTQRIRELHLSKSFRWMIVWINMVASMPQILAPLVTFAAYAIRSRVDDSDSLSVARAFASLAIVSLVTSPMVNLLASIPALRVAEGCLERIQKFVLSAQGVHRDDHPGSRTPSERGFTGSDSQQEMTTLDEAKRERNGLLVETEDVSLRPAKGAQLVLENVNLLIAKGKLTIFIGPVGSGKTTLLKAFLGEIVPERGSLSVFTKSLAYCSQTPWLPNGSFRDVLCGPAEYEEAWYNTVIYACDLEDDLEQLPQGDASIIGSRGSVLSGGQRQRLVLISP